MRCRALPIIAVAAAGLLASTLATGLLAGNGPMPLLGGSRDARGSSNAHEHATGAGAGHEHADSPAGAHDHSAGLGEEHVERALPRHEHFASGERGEVPTRAEAGQLPVQLQSFTVRGDAGLAEMADLGYVRGSGTLEDPYVIDGFRVRGGLSITDTTRALIIRNSLVEGQLTLNYIGHNVYVHHNRVHDLRVNENIGRAEVNTGGLFEHNVIEFIGQLRHFTGEFAHNMVGPRPAAVQVDFLGDSGVLRVPDGLVWNFDGYHLAHVHNNTVVGRVDVKLHGHYHGDCNGCEPHDHANRSEYPELNYREQGLAPGSHHSYRFHTIDFEHNSISVDAGTVALRFYDEAHAGDDRTANSEPNAYLQDLHEHHTFLRIAGNRIEGGSLALDIVNAPDERHERQVQEALVHLVGNRVELPRPPAALESETAGAAYVVHAVEGIALVAENNRFAFVEEASVLPAAYRSLLEPHRDSFGFALVRADDANVRIVRTAGEGATYGLLLRGVTSRVTVVLDENRFNAKEDVYRD